MAAATVYEQITDKLITAMENTKADWQKPWQSLISEGTPRNAESGKAYKGINRFSLSMSGRTSPVWATFKQWQAKGCQVIKGSKGTLGVYYSSFERTTEEGEEVRGVFAKAFWLFNAEQVEGYEEETKPSISQNEKIHHAETFFRNTQAVINHGGNRAFYSPSLDSVTMPHLAQFQDSESYYATLAHELTHWTSHKSRCDRQLGKRFADSAYAAEELIAELGAAFLCGDLSLSLEPRKDHAQYLNSWLSVLKQDKRAIFAASAAAQKAVDYLQSLQVAQVPQAMAA